jgi:hypothetical protein
MLTRSLSQLMESAREAADAEGESALARHPDDKVRDYVNRGIAAFQRIVADAAGAATVTITTSVGSTLYALPVDFGHLLSAELGPNSAGHQDWLLRFDVTERADLSRLDASTSLSRYRLQGDNIEILPGPRAGQRLTLWYIPSATQLDAPGELLDVGARYDDYIICYAAREMGTKDRAWDLVGQMAARLGEIEPKIRKYMRSRDQANPPRVRDVWSHRVDRFGRTSRRGRP